MKFSLVLATVGRVEELRRFLSALKSQNCPNVEVLLVDQNSDERLKPLLTNYSSELNIERIRCAPGLSRARNAALPRLTGGVAAFPDDDCWYPPGLLHRVAQFFSDHPGCAGITGRHMLPTEAPSPGWDRRAGWVTRKNVWRRGISFTIFLRKEVVDSVGDFDERLGAGSPGGEGEETDYLLSALAKGFRIYYDPNLLVFHPNLRRYDVAARKKQYTDAMGLGRLLRKHHYPVPLVSYFFVRPLGGTLFKFVTGRPGEALRHWAMFRGRIAGYRSAF